MKLHVWMDCFSDYTDGLAVVLATDSESARDLLRKEIEYNHPDLSKKPEELNLDVPIAFYVYGGG